MKKMRRMRRSRPKSVLRGPRARAGVYKSLDGRYRRPKKTPGGLKKHDLKRSKYGRKIVAKRHSAASEIKAKTTVAPWGKAVKEARMTLGITGFCACGGKTERGQTLLKKTREIYEKNGGKKAKIHAEVKTNDNNQQSANAVENLQE